MVLTAMNDFNDTTSFKDYLDVSSLAEGVRYTKLAYVQSTNVGIQKNNGGFVSFYLKDCNGCRITARLFNVEDFMISGIKASAFAHCPVKLTFVPQIFAGSMSLVIDSKIGIERYGGEFDYGRFIGKIDVPYEDISNVARAAGLEDWSVPIDWKTRSIDSICSGKAGGFAALVYGSMCSVSANASAAGLGVSETMRIYFAAIQLFFDYLIDKSKNPVLTELINPNVLSRVKLLVAENSEEYLPTYDTTRALCGLGKPLGIEAHLIKRSVDLAMFIVNAKDSLSLIPSGTKAYVGGVDLLKY